MARCFAISYVEEEGIHHEVIYALQQGGFALSESPSPEKVFSSLTQLVEDCQYLTSPIGELTCHDPGQFLRQTRYFELHLVEFQTIFDLFPQPAVGPNSA